MKTKFQNSNKVYNFSFRNKLTKGFTIIELLIAMTITIVIVGLLLSMTKIAVGAWQVTSKKAKSSRLANEVFEVVGKDLEGIVFRSGNNFEWLYIDENLTDVTSAELGPTNKEIANALDINFFTATPDRYDGQVGTTIDEGGDVSMVRYRLVYQDVIDRDNAVIPVYSLYRDRIEPDETFDKLLGQTELSPAFSNLDSDDIHLEENILADNIYDFTLSFNFEYTNDDGTKGFERVTVQSDESATNSSLSIKGDEILVGDDNIDLPAGASAPRLVNADISVFVISDGGMRALENAPINSAQEFSQFLKEHGDSYTRSILLPQR